MTAPRARVLVLISAIALTPALVARTQPPKGAPPVATALAFAHHFATPQALTPAKDRALKVKLTTTLARSRELTWDDARDHF
ncbi:MAG TPA: hypothetical protein VMZ71_05200, partial [Gemmataceae bacterium]|nr:hypothetical protein [Gemmataceae bacterium]